MDTVEITEKPSLNHHIPTNPVATFYARVKGDNKDEGVKEGDLLVIDKSQDPNEGDLAVMISKGHLELKRLENAAQDIKWYATGDERSRIWGKVVYVIKSQR